MVTFHRFAGYPAILSIPLDIRPSNPVSGRIPDLKKRPDYPAGYPADRISGASLIVYR
jgi:hypothetical protein